MSCEENRIRYFERVSSGGSALAGALGGEPEARAALEQIFNTARNDGARIGSPLQQHRAAGRTLQLFEEMEHAHGLARPTHSTQGMRLPRRDAQFGYQAVYDTIEAARTGRPLPEVATRVLQQRQLRRTVTSLRLDDHGYFRCANCGQFASRTRGHVCPFTATSADFERALQRRLGTPRGAYMTSAPDGSEVDGLQEVIDAARNSPSGTLRMVHCLTGEEADVTLDGAISALSQGFVPQTWRGRESLRHVELPDRRVVAVLNASGLHVLYPGHVLGYAPDEHTSAEGESPCIGAVEAAAVAYGHALPSGTEVRSLGSVPSRRSLDPQQTSESLASLDDMSAVRVPLTPEPWVSSSREDGTLPLLLDPTPPSAPPALPAAAPLSPPVTESQLARSSVGGPGGSGGTGKPVLLKPTELQGGKAYDWGHFTGTEYRKSGSHGTPITACGRAYRVGDRSTDPQDWARARRTGAEPAPKGGVAVGRTLVAAVDLLSSGQVVADASGSGRGSVQLYNSDGSELLAVYDPNTATAGDTEDNSSASPAQMAALLAYWEAHGHSHPDTSSAPVRSLVADLQDLRGGTGSPLAVADSAYLVLRDQLSGGGSVTLGAHVSTVRCPDCGQWMGDVHNCPVRRQTEVTQETAPSVQTQPVDQDQQTQATPNRVGLPLVTDTPDLASDQSTPTASVTGSASVATAAPVSSAAEVNQSFAHTLTEAFDRLGERLGEQLGSTLAGHFAGVQAASPHQGQTHSPAEERMAAALDRLTTILQRWPAPDGGSPINEGTSVSARGNTGRRKAGTPDSRSTASDKTSQPVASLTPAQPPQPPERPPLDVLPLTPQEHILRHVTPPEPPDPYLSRLDPRLGGQRMEPLPLHYEEVDPSYDVSAGAEKALRIVSSSLQIAWDPNRRKPLRGTQMRVFGFAGTAGTGKNTTARQIAASLRLPYYETTLHRDTSLQEEIGQTVLQDGTTVPKLGSLGQAAAAGGVICINELVKANPGTLGALQRMMEDGVFEVQGTEAGIAAKEIPVHPSTVFICTWNPGYDGSSDRPDAALLSRVPTIRMDAPDVRDETRRIVGSLDALFGTEGSGEGGEAVDEAGAPDSKAAQQKQERLQEILGRDYAVRRARSSAERVEIAVRFVRDLRNLAQTRQIGASSRHLLEPTPREALHFAAICEATGDPLLALEQFRIYCDSGEAYDEQWKLVQQIFKRYYGEDGQALNRRASGQGPKQS